MAQGKQQGRTVEQLQAAITPATLKSLASGGWGQYIAEQTVQFDWDAAFSTPAEALAGGLKGSIAATFKALERA